MPTPCEVKILPGLCIILTTSALEKVSTGSRYNLVSFLMGAASSTFVSQTHGIVIQGKPMNPDYLREALAKGEIPSPGAYFQDTIAVAAQVHSPTLSHSSCRLVVPWWYRSQTTSRSAPQRAATFSPRERMQDFPLNAATEIKRSRGIPGPGQYSVHAPRTKVRCYSYLTLNSQ